MNRKVNANSKVSRFKVKGYGDAGASKTRRSMKGFNAKSGSPREDIDVNNFTLRQRARMLYMSASPATSAININRTKIVGPGLKLKSSINRELLGLSTEEAKVWQKKAEAEFNMWASKRENCDATGMNDFDSLQQVACIAWLTSGDNLGLIKRYEPKSTNPYSLRIHLIEADRVSTPSSFKTSMVYNQSTLGKNEDTGNRIFDGVEVDDNGMVVAYHVRNTYPNERTVEDTIWTRVEAFGERTSLPNILHIMDSERCDQYRGVTYLAQVLEQMVQVKQYTESELLSVLVQSYFTAWIKTKDEGSNIPINETGGDSIVSGFDDEEVFRKESSSDEYEMGPATVLSLNEGEDVIFGNPNIPTAGFENFMKVMFQMIGASLEIPREILMKEFNKSYSASRAAILEMWEAIRRRRSILVKRFCQPVYEIFLAEAVARGRIKAPGFFEDPVIRSAWCGALWIGPVQGQLDPKKEVEAAITAIGAGFKTHEQATREQGGGDWDNNVEQLKRENEKLVDAGVVEYKVTPSESKTGEGED